MIKDFQSVLSRRENKMKKIIKIMSGFLKRMNQDHVSAFAAQAAFFILMSFVPFLMLLLPVVTYISITKEMVIEMLLQIMPDAGDFRSFLLDIIQEVYDKSTAVVPISAVFTLWSAGKGLQGLTNGVNAIYHVKETRNYVITRIRSALYTLVFILAVLSSLVLLVFGNSIQKLLTRYIPALARITAYIIGMRTAISLVILALIFLMIYKFLPNRKASFRSQMPGAVVSALAWSLFSLGFSIYLDYFNGFSNMYGSLTTIILILLWLYFCMYIILIGAEINAYFEERLRRLHRLASERIRNEYQGLLKGIRDDSDDEEESKEAMEKSLIGDEKKALDRKGESY